MRENLIGSRIRERRIMLGLRQAELARNSGISAPYLNLIEHNKRRIGGKLLLDLATALETEPSLLSEGAEAALLSALHEAALSDGGIQPELDRLDEFTGRFPGWSKLIAAQHQKSQNLERTVATLTDRLAHDPNLAASMHELLSMVAAIRSTADILHDSEELKPEWRQRFQRNLTEDSARLADSAQAVLGYLDAEDEAADKQALPQVELDHFLAHHRYHFPVLEGAADVDIDALLASDLLGSAAARSLAKRFLHRYQRDARDMPLADCQAVIDTHGLRPDILAQHFEVGIAAALRRCAMLPVELVKTPVGLVISDAAGTLLLRRPIEGFEPPQFSAACAKWPLFDALTQPMTPVQQRIEMAGRDAEQFDCYAICEPVELMKFGQPPVFQATMLIVPASEKRDDCTPVGPHCQICPRSNCAARSTPSIFGDGI